MHLRRTGALIAAILMLLLLWGCGAGSEDEADSTPTSGSTPSSADALSRMTMLTPGTGGTWYPGGGAMAELLTGELDDVVVSVEATSGSPENVRLLAEGDAEFAWLDWGTVNRARQGEDYVDEPAENVVALGPVYGGYYHFAVAADSDIHSLEDFHGRRVNTGPPGSGTESQLAEFLPFLGFSSPPWDDFQQEPLGVGEAAEALANRRIDVATLNAAPPNPSVMQLATSIDIRLIELTQEQIDTITGEFPWYAPITIRGGVYPGVDDDVQTITPPAGVFTTTSLPEDLVYEVTKLLYSEDGFQQLTDTVVSFDAVDFSQIELMPFPLHPGAERFWKESGVLDE